MYDGDRQGSELFPIRNRNREASPLDQCSKHTEVGSALIYENAKLPLVEKDGLFRLLSNYSDTLTAKSKVAPVLK
jgi:hypothetical protein